MCHAALCGVVGAIGSFYNLWGPPCMAARQAFVTGSFEAGRHFMLGFQAALGEILRQAIRLDAFCEPPCG